MKKFLICAMSACMLLSGCTESNIVNTNKETYANNPDFSKHSDVEIDWAQVSEECDEFFTDTNEFEYARDFSFYLAPEQKEIMLIWTVADDFPAEETMNYAEYLIKGFNDTVAEQDFSIEVSSDETFGGLWKNYGVSFSIVPESTPDDESTWFISAKFEEDADINLDEAASAE